MQSAYSHQYGSQVLVETVVVETDVSDVDVMETVVAERVVQVETVVIDTVDELVGVMVVAVDVAQVHGQRNEARVQSAASPHQ